MNRLRPLFGRWNVASGTKVCRTHCSSSVRPAICGSIPGQCRVPFVTGPMATSWIQGRWLSSDSRYGNAKHQVPSNSSYEELDEEDLVEYAPEELIPGPTMLKRIVADLEKQGITFVIPWGDSDAVDAIVEPFAYIISIGVQPSFVLSACVAEPRLFAALARKGAAATRVLDVLFESAHMNYEDGMRYLASYSDELLQQGWEAIQKRIDRLVAAGLDSPRKVARAIRHCPALLFAVDEEHLGRASEALGGFFSRKEIAAILHRSPAVLLQSIGDIEEKYEYIFFQMCIEGEQFVECEKWAELPLNDIISRHEFLVKCGRYVTPDKKNPQLKMLNPTLHDILDASDEHFACAVAKVSVEEWMLFQGLRESWQEPRTFERVKPSQRKAYERRMKESKQREAHVFESGTEDEL